MYNKKHLICAILLLSLLFGCGGSSDSPPPAPAPVVNFTGSGTNITDAFHCGGELVTFEFQHTGSSNFIVRLRNNDSGEIEIYLVNEIGAFEGTVPGAPAKGNYFLEIDADGDWTIKITGDVS